MSHKAWAGMHKIRAWIMVYKNQALTKQQWLSAVEILRMLLAVLQHKLCA
jgi:hypothetical protein